MGCIANFKSLEDRLAIWIEDETLLLTEKQAAALIGIHANTLAKWRREGLITAVSPDPDKHRLYYRRQDVEAFVDGMEVAR